MLYICALRQTGVLLVHEIATEENEGIGRTRDVSLGATTTWGLSSALCLRRTQVLCCGEDMVVLFVYLIVCEVEPRVSMCFVCDWGNVRCEFDHLLLESAVDARFCCEELCTGLWSVDAMRPKG